MTSGAASTSPTPLAGIAGGVGAKASERHSPSSMEASSRSDLACAAPAHFNDREMPA